MLIIALVVGALGFTGIAKGPASIAKFIFVAFLAILAPRLRLGSAWRHRFVLRTSVRWPASRACDVCVPPHSPAWSTHRA
ncbi:DUF1328 domain-containing protein [Bradyrhizobium icense]|uniref:DUF1328 domain-containing protein n=1 Tax=Bradyrhizobium icense TaxID=1274631 RepID=UPI003AB07410